MADPDSIPTLFMLTMTALIQHVKDRKIKKFTPDQIPIPVNQLLWNESSALDLITNTCHPETRDWFSNRVIQPPMINVNFTERMFGMSHGLRISIQFQGRRPMDWDLKGPERVDTRTGPEVIIRTGNQHLSTILYNPERNIISSINNYARAKFEVINWICKVFRCEIQELEVYHVNEEFMNDWPKLKTATSLRIRTADKDQSRVVSLITSRHLRSLKTKIDNIEFPNPIRREILKYIDFKRAHVNLCSLKISELGEVLSEISIRTDCCYVNAKTMNFTDDHLELFKLQLDLTEDETKLNEDFQPISTGLVELNVPFFPNVPGLSPSIPSPGDNYRQFYFIKNKIFAVVFWFLQEKSGVYDRVVMSHFEKKSDPLVRALRPQPVVDYLVQTFRPRPIHIPRFEDLFM
ncbi:hypothetical protein CAEBREN_15997 [Caenorhabditis brenneri]|uniref:Uncharacterized protein n=1 Tax=Caenorhabditis brenneri TaxID=135651 RepID=G0MA87_CAEBE|nr:hypothetical protein CAEBREN_15997 [Caenorhabditis brenneri]